MEKKKFVSELFVLMLHFWGCWKKCHCVKEKFVGSLNRPMRFLFGLRHVISGKTKTQYLNMVEIYWQEIGRRRNLKKRHSKLALQ